ncbi:cobyrinic acid a,c-diamide synthase [Anopheles sinensis]|uniref:Cobyrinic acid a,c-diamide synthase n=1 Tax=Anopheles sinensis TaxID=74873 RepID=A0A084VY93_ANOSI|nr:cobyrinic acid a,c-diamide synthase [Anopheles sinensis]
MTTPDPDLRRRRMLENAHSVSRKAVRERARSVREPKPPSYVRGSVHGTKVSNHPSTGIFRTYGRKTFPLILVPPVGYGKNHDRLRFGGVTLAAYSTSVKNIPQFPPEDDRSAVTRPDAGILIPESGRTTPLHTRKIKLGRRWRLRCRGLSTVGCRVAKQQRLLKAKDNDKD